MKNQDQQFLQFSIQSKIIRKKHPCTPKKPRQPIFNGSAPKQQTSSIFDHISFNPEQTQPQKPLTSTLFYDFCGCETSTSPCKFIKLIMNESEVEQMQQSYEDTKSNAEQQEPTLQARLRRKELMRGLPSNYPQVYEAPLHSLLNVTGDRISSAEFSCLYSIQYHSKLQPLTYFLFKDLKSSYSDKNKFINKLNLALLSVSSSYHEERKHYGDAFDIFVSDYYNSIGAFVIPHPLYGKFIEYLFEGGSTVLVECLVELLKMRNEFRNLLVAYHQDLQAFHGLRKEVNWEVLLNK